MEQRATPHRGGSSVFARRWRCRALAALLTALLASGLAAAAAAQLRDGEVEAGALLGVGGAPGGDHRPRYLLLRTLGLLVGDRWDLGVQLGLSGDYTTAPSSAVLGCAQYLFAPLAPVTPYVGALAGVEADLFTDAPRVAEALGPQLGVKWRLGDALLLSAELRYTLQVAHPQRGVLLFGFGVAAVDAPPDE